MSPGQRFVGMRYATAARWEPPELVTVEAEGPYAACPQPDRPVARFTHGDPPPQSEDCLNLTIHTPGRDGSRPVLVWLHGGGFATGHAGASLYDGSRLAEGADLVVVAVNYRLGSFGWLCHPGLAAGPDAPAGNWGLLDQIAALRWIQDHIAAFGGDPGRVTVAGQSAGALAALDLLVAPGTDGLFARLILQSPPLGDVAQPAEAGERFARALSTASHGGGDFDVRRLRALAAHDLVALHETVLAQPEFVSSRGALPTIEPVSLPCSPLADPGVRPEVDVLIGANAHEGTFFFASPWRPAPPIERVPAIVAHLCPGEDPARVLEDQAARAAAAGTSADLNALLIDIATERMVGGPARAFARARRQAGARVFEYRVDHPGAGPQLRATHTAEVPLLFGTWQDGGPGERLGGSGPDPSPVSERLVAAWAGFVRDGDPGWGPGAHHIFI